MKIGFKRTVLVFGLVVVGLLVLPYLLPLPTGVDAAQLADADGAFITIDGIRTYYVEHGPEDGPVTLLLHGFGGSTFSWRDNISALADAGYRVIAYDRPGFGLSDKSASYDYSPAAQAEFTASLMDALDIRSASLIGHSAGGSVIAHFAVRYPDRTEKLIIVDGAIFSGGGSSLASTLLAFPPFGRWFEVLAPRLITPDRFTSLLASAYGDPAIVTPEVNAGYARALETPGWMSALLGMMRNSEGKLTDDQIEGISAPTLLVWGDNDTWVPVSEGRALLELMPDAVWQSYPQVGHLPMEEVPAQFNRDVLAFLSTR